VRPLHSLKVSFGIVLPILDEIATCCTGNPKRK
jgi:hypothetical protein